MKKQDPLVSIKIIPGTVITALVGPELLDLVLATCNYEASGDGVVLVDTDQLENTQDTSGQIGEMAEEIQRASLELHQSLGSEATKAQYTGLILLRA